MIRRGVIAMSLIFNAVQILALVALDIHSIWFDRYELRNVGPGVIYAAYAFTTVLLALFANVALWFVVRRNRLEARLVRLAAGVGLLAVVALTWAGDHFMYAGIR
jgi:hypothetical protein